VRPPQNCLFYDSRQTLFCPRVSSPWRRVLRAPSFRGCLKVRPIRDDTFLVNFSRLKRVILPSLTRDPKGFPPRWTCCCFLATFPPGRMSKRTFFCGTPLVPPDCSEKFPPPLHGLSRPENGGSSSILFSKPMLLVNIPKKAVNYLSPRLHSLSFYVPLLRRGLGDTSPLGAEKLSNRLCTWHKDGCSSLLFLFILWILPFFLLPKAQRRYWITFYSPPMVFFSLPLQCQIRILDNVSRYAALPTFAGTGFFSPFPDWNFTFIERKTALFSSKVFFLRVQKAFSGRALGVSLFF